MINLILPQSCSVTRSIVDWSDGSPSYVWAEIATNVPCLFSPRDWEAWHADSEPQKSRMNGTMFFEPDADIQPGDSVKVRTLGSFTIGEDGGRVDDWTGEPHHAEWAVRQTKQGTK